MVQGFLRKRRDLQKFSFTKRGTTTPKVLCGETISTGGVRGREKYIILRFFSQKKMDQERKRKGFPNGLKI